jgi:hypothetical protein
MENVGHSTAVFVAGVHLLGGPLDGEVVPVFAHLPRVLCATRFRGQTQPPSVTYSTAVQDVRWDAALTVVWDVHSMPGSDCGADQAGRTGVRPKE